MTFMSQFMWGFTTFWGSLATLRKHKGLKKYIYLPILISILFLFLSFYLLGGEGSAYLMSLLPIEQGGFFYWLIYSVFFVFAFLFSVLFAYVFANIVNIPFHAFLCSAFYKKAYSWSEPDYSVLQVIKVSIYFLIVGIIKTLILLAISILCFLLSFFPPLSLFVAFVGLMVVAFDFCDISFEILEFDLSKRFHFIRRNFWQFVGFTCGLSIVSLIPGFNFLFMPFMILSASKMVYELNNKED
tara:strand:- start:11296 stop:12021 length:726 start_codon:yes stop_codon:yes gene_type:complete